MPQRSTLRHGFSRLPLLKWVKSNEEYPKEKEWENIGHISHPVLHFQSSTSVGFCHKVFPTPAPVYSSEEQENQGAHWQNDITHQKSSRSRKLLLPPKDESQEKIKAQSAGQAKGSKVQWQSIDEARPSFSAPSKGSMQQEENILKDRQHGGQRQKGHKDKEECSQKVPHWHVVEDVRQRDKNQFGARTRPPRGR